MSSKCKENEFDELPNRVKNYNRREDTFANIKATTPGSKAGVRDAEELEANAIAELDEIRNSIHRVREKIYNDLHESIGRRTNV